MRMSTLMRTKIDDDDDEDKMFGKQENKIRGNE